MKRGIFLLLPLIFILTPISICQKIHVGIMDLELGMTKKDVLFQCSLNTELIYSFSDDSNIVNIFTEKELVGSLTFANDKLVEVIKNWGVFTELMLAINKLFQIFEYYKVDYSSIKLERFPDLNNERKRIFFMINDLRTIIIDIYSHNIQLLEWLAYIQNK